MDKYEDFDTDELRKLTQLAHIIRTTDAREETVLTLTNGKTLHTGPTDGFVMGGYVRICSPTGKELYYWDKAQLARDPEKVMGAIFRAAISDLRL